MKPITILGNGMAGFRTGVAVETGGVPLVTTGGPSQAWPRRVA